MDNKMQVTIDGKQIDINMGVNAFYQFYKEDSGHDLVKDPKMTLFDPGSVALFEHIQSMIWGGYRAHLLVTKAAKGEISREDVRYFIMAGDEAIALDIAYQLWACRLGMTLDEFRGMVKKNREAMAAADTVDDTVADDPKP